MFKLPCILHSVKYMISNHLYGFTFWFWIWNHFLAQRNYWRQVERRCPLSLEAWGQLYTHGGRGLYYTTKTIGRHSCQMQLNKRLIYTRNPTIIEYLLKFYFFEEKDIQSYPNFYFEILYKLTFGGLWKPGEVLGNHWGQKYKHTHVSKICQSAFIHSVTKSLIH